MYDCHAFSGSSWADEQETQIPIVALTAYAMSSDRDKFLAEGMDAYLAKPLELEALSALIPSVLQKRKK